MLNKLVTKKCSKYCKRDRHLVQEAFRMPHRHGWRRVSSSHIMAPVLRLQNKKTIVKASREMHRVTIKANSAEWQFPLYKPYNPKRFKMIYFKAERVVLASYTTSSKTFLWSQRRNKTLPQ